MSLALDMLSSVSILVVVVVGMAVIVSMMGVFNLAHGQFVLLGAVGYLLLDRHVVGGFTAILIVVVLAGMAGAAIEVAAMRRLYGQPIATVLATFGIGLVITGLVREAIGNTAQGVEAPVRGVVQLGDYRIEEWRLWIIGLAALSVACTFWVLERTALGLKIRATLLDPALAQVSGVRARPLFTFTFALGTALAAFSGALIAPLTSVFPELGVSYLVLSFLAVMVGGPGTFIGPIVGAVVIGTANVGLARMISPTYAQVFIVLAAVIFMRARPFGLLGNPRGFISKEI